MHKERFNLNLGEVLKLGDKQKLKFELTADKDFTVVRLIVNAPCHNFLIVKSIVIAGKERVIQGPEDGRCYSADNFFDTKWDATLKKGEKIQVEGEYTGLAPAPYTKGSDYYGSFMFQALSDMED